MLGATVVELAKDRHALAVPGQATGGQMLIGGAVAFLVALAVIRTMVTFVSRHGFAPFAWYRIAAGVAALIWLGLG